MCGICVLPCPTGQSRPGQPWTEGWAQDHVFLEPEGGLHRQRQIHWPKVPCPDSPLDARLKPNCPQAPHRLWLCLTRPDSGPIAVKDVSAHTQLDHFCSKQPSSQITDRTGGDRACANVLRSLKGARLGSHLPADQ